MIYFFNADGTLIKQTPSVVVQGSSESNKIYFVAPLLPTGAVRVGFNLPNGHMTAKYLLTNDGAVETITPDGKVSITDGDGNEYYIWERELPPTVTKQAGEVSCQFYYTNAGGQTIATVSVGFTVATGVTTLTPPEDLPEDTYQYIAEILATISATKRDKYTPSSNGTYAYTVTKNGDTINDSAIKVDESATGSTIPVRTATGQLNVPETPSGNLHASSKKYVDDKTYEAILTVKSFSNDKFVPKTTEVNGKALSGDITLDASDVDALPNTTKYGAGITFTINPSTFVMLAQLLDQDGNALGTAKTIDLPLESVVVSGSYDADTKKVVLTLQNGSTIEFSVADLIDGLQAEITAENKLSADLIENGTTNKVFTATEQTKLSGIESGAEVNDVNDVQINGVSVVSGKIAVIVTETAYDPTTNPIATKSDVDGLKDDLESGQVVPQKSLITKQIEAVSSESGTIQDAPFISQGTGTANGTSIVDTSPVGKHLEKQGNTVVVNQLVKNGDFSDGKTNWFDGGNVSMTVNNGVATIVNTGSVAPVYQNVGSAILGHKYLVSYTCRTESGTVTGGYGYGANYKTSVFTFTTDKKAFFSILQPSTTDGYFYIYLTSGTIYVDDVFLIDLTQWFGSNDLIPADLLSHPEHFSWYYNGDLSYNVGEIRNCAGRFLECGQSRNVWDEEIEIGGINPRTGAETPDTNTLRSKNYTRIIPNMQYYFRFPSSLLSAGVYSYWYDKNYNFIKANLINTANANFIKTTDSNAVYFRIVITSGYGTTYNHDITISLYYTTGDSYDEYFPYIAPKTYDTGTEVLRSAGTARDRKEPDGTITRIISSVKLNTLSFTEYTLSNNRTAFTVSGFSSNYGAKAPSLPSIKANILCNRAITVSQDNAWKNGDVCVLAIEGSAGSAGSLAFIVTTGSFSDATAFKNHFTDDDYLYYELATPTTEQGTLFVDYVDINDYSYMACKDTNGDLVDIPQGCKIFYPSDYVLFIDSLGQREDVEWDASVLAVKNDTKLYKHNIYLHLYNNSVDVRLYLSFVSRSNAEVDDSFIDANFDIMQVDTKNSIDEVDFTTKPIKLLECAFATGGGTCKVLEWTGSAVIEKSLTGNGATDTVTEFTGN